MEMVFKGFCEGCCLARSNMQKLTGFEICFNALDTTAIYSAKEISPITAWYEVR